LTLTQNLPGDLYVDFEGVFESEAKVIGTYASNMQKAEDSHEATGTFELHKI
jgi:hypothetical protein